MAPARKPGHPEGPIRVFVGALCECLAARSLRDAEIRVVCHDGQVVRVSLLITKAYPVEPAARGSTPVRKGAAAAYEAGEPLVLAEALAQAVEAIRSLATETLAELIQEELRFAQIDALIKDFTVHSLNINQRLKLS